MNRIYKMVHAKQRKDELLHDNQSHSRRPIGEDDQILTSRFKCCTLGLYVIFGNMSSGFYFSEETKDFIN